MISFLKILRILIYTFVSYFFLPKSIIELINIKSENALYLTPFRREKGLDKLLNKQGIGIISLSHDYQKKISNIFFGSVNLKYYEFVNHIRNYKLGNFFYKIYLNNLIKFLKKKYNLKFVINFAIHYKSEYLFDYISTKNKLNFFTLHRECLYANENTKNTILSKLKITPKYSGKKIIVHNDIVKNIFINSGFCTNEQIIKIGPLKIDESLNFENIPNKNINILFYIFGTGSMIHKGKTYGSDWGIDYGWFKLLKNTYGVILDCAEKYPNVKFIFKAKYDSKGFKSYHDEQSKNYKLKNVEYHTEEVNYDLLRRSNLVISFNSTTIIEAALFKKNILVPYFDEALEETYSEFVGFKELKKTVCECASKEIFKEKIINFIENQMNFSLENKEREKLLKSYLGEIDGLNSERLKKILY